MQELNDIETGPVLRGLSNPSGPGALWRLASPGATQPTPADTRHAGGSSPLELSAPLRVDTIVEAWNEHRGKYNRYPSEVTMPSGNRWTMEQVAPSGDPIDNAGPETDLAPHNLAGALTDRVAIVTGAAQGFGWEIARGLAALGAVVALADINLEGTQARAKELGKPHGAFPVNVSDEQSVTDMAASVTARYGGVDLVVSNAGVLKAGSVKELTLKDFRFVTDVNYIGFFLMTKHCAPVMELQNSAARAVDPNATYLTDIVEINSKSGLEGSNKNSAYAGSKFGGIGLVQSFALELVEQGTKVNAICPGNYLDGPLWSDPERGLFVQYLHTGKVPGATTIDEVRRFYEKKVPMQRGCTGRDVVRALAYVVSQGYETGQAVPVTGGQVMLS